MLNKIMFVSTFCFIFDLEFLANYLTYMYMWLLGLRCQVENVLNYSSRSWYCCYLYNQYMAGSKLTFGTLIANKYMAKIESRLLLILKDHAEKLRNSVYDKLAYVKNCSLFMDKICIITSWK